MSGTRVNRVRMWMARKLVPKSHAIVQRPTFRVTSRPASGNTWDAADWSKMGARDD